MKLKQRPEDFIVKEKNSVEISDKGRYTYFRLKKTNYTTNAALVTIARIFRIPRKFFGYAGNKDRRAVTEQICSVKGRISNKELKDIQIEVLGRGRKPISLGDLDQNYFEITVRDIENKPKKIEKVVNYFDSQRFGKNKNNQEVGRLIIKGRFGQAAQLIDNHLMQNYLQKHENEYIGALRKIPRKILTLYIHAYQSDIWNKCVKQYIEECEKPKSRFPIVGFATEFDDELIEKICMDELKKDNITQRDFIIRQLPELTSQGAIRKIFSRVYDLEIGNLEKDELNPGKNKVKICFSLKPGCYATLVIKNLFNNHNLV
ncbi:MAG: putative tRNA pseudouridine synthase D [Candidatus Woesearchaeota archaeon]|nr:putative tRNA pseudouridine synthase D [Candidatus Woesearchaeota archaeon]